MQENWNARIRLLAGGALVAAAGLMSGCMSSPTYGTDKSANSQLVSDLGGIMSFSDKKRAPIDYSPRPELVKPVKGGEALPAPQETITTAAADKWPESPEQRLARIRDEATANQNNSDYESPVIVDGTGAAPGLPAKSENRSWRAVESGQKDSAADKALKEEAAQRKLIEQQSNTGGKRRYLSDPPSDYKVASSDAPQGELGEDEADKERRLKKEAKKAAGKGSFSWDDLNPF